MSPRASLSVRWARAAAVGAVALGTGVIAHVAADGLLPGPSGLVVLALASTVAAAAFLGREASALRLVVLVVGGQTLVHTGLAAMAGHRGDPVSAPAAAVHRVLPSLRPGPRTGSYYDQWTQAHPSAAGAGPVVPAWLVHSFADLAAHPVMAVAHVFAAIAVGLWLSVGERALWSVLTLTAALALALVRRLHGALAAGPLPVPTPARVRRTPEARARLPRRPVWSGPLTRRGPPALLTAA